MGHLVPLFTLGKVITTVLFDHRFPHPESKMHKDELCIMVLDGDDKTLCSRPPHRPARRDSEDFG